jgi:hypothetical protein
VTYIYALLVLVAVKSIIQLFSCKLKRMLKESTFSDTKSTSTPIIIQWIEISSDHFEKQIDQQILKMYAQMRGSM